MEQPVVLLTGPTASGKSALALELARRLELVGGAVIINADSMQVYRELHIVTARPTTADEAMVPHRLYGILPATEAWSAAAFCAQAHDVIAEAHAQGRIALVVGGTGLYLRALLEGLAPIPKISAAVREEARALMDRLGPEAFHRRLAEKDPETAAMLGTTDRQRQTRAWEVSPKPVAPLPNGSANHPRAGSRPNGARGCRDAATGPLRADRCALCGDVRGRGIG